MEEPPATAQERLLQSYDFEHERTIPGIEQGFGISEVLLDGDTVYVSNDYRVIRVDPNGPVDLVKEDVHSNNRLLAGDGAYIYFTTNNTIRRVPKNGGAVETIVAHPSLSGLTVRDGVVYFESNACENVGSESTSICIQKISAGGTPSLVAAIPEGAAPRGHAPLAVHESGFYYAWGGPTVSHGTIARIALSGGDPTVLHEGTFSAGAFTPDGADMYWLTGPTYTTQTDPTRLFRLSPGQTSPSEVGVVGGGVAINDVGFYWGDGDSQTINAAPRSDIQHVTRIAAGGVPSHVAANDKAIAWLTPGQVLHILPRKP